MMLKITQPRPTSPFQPPTYVRSSCPAPPPTPNPSVSCFLPPSCRAAAITTTTTTTSTADKRPCSEAPCTRDTAGGDRDRGVWSRWTTAAARRGGRRVVSRFGSSNNDDDSVYPPEHAGMRPGTEEQQQRQRQELNGYGMDKGWMGNNWASGDDGAVSGMARKAHVASRGSTKESMEAAAKQSVPLKVMVFVDGTWLYYSFFGRFV